MRRTLFFLSFFPSIAWGGIVINEAAFDQPSGSPDWVELFNTGPATVSIDGWTLGDEDAAEENEIVIRLPEPVPAGGYVVVHVDAAGVGDADFSDGFAAVYSGTATTVSLAATEDELALRSPEGIVDFIAWVTDGSYGGGTDQADAVAAGVWVQGDVLVLTDLGTGYSIARASDGRDTNASGDFASTSSPTPGRSNVLAPSPSSGAHPLDVVINEIAWGGTAASASHEWIELFNASTGTVVMNGWRLRNADGDIEARLSGELPAGGYWLMERGSDLVVGGRTADFIYSGSLSNGGEELALEDGEGNVIDAVRFGGGWPAGTGAPEYRSMERVSPGSAGVWRSNDGSLRVGTDAAGAPLNGTPGERNSAFGVFHPSGDAATGGAVLSVDPAANPFSPSDPDPARRSARIYFDGGSAEAAKTLRICDVRGETVRVFSDGRGLDGAAGVLLWDGRDGEGRNLPAGLYLIYFEAVEPSGARRRGRGMVALGYPR